MSRSLLTSSFLSVAGNHVSAPFLLCCCSVTQACLTLCDAVDCSTPGFPILHHLLEFARLMAMTLVMPSNHPILCRPFSSRLQSFPASGSFPRSQLFPSGGQRTGLQLQHRSFQWISQVTEQLLCAGPGEPPSLRSPMMNPYVAGDTQKPKWAAHRGKRRAWAYAVLTST